MGEMSPKASQWFTNKTHLQLIRDNIKDLMDSCRIKLIKILMYIKLKLS